MKIKNLFKYIKHHSEKNKSIIYIEFNMPYSKKKTNLSRKYKSRKNNNNKLYYIIRTKFLDKNKIKNVMGSKLVWEEFNIKNPQQNNPDFILVDKDSANDRDLWHYNTQLKSQVDFKSDNSLENKFILIQSLQKLKNPRIDKFLLAQYHINLYEIFTLKVNLNKYKKLFNSQKVWIFKFIYGNVGKNIIVIDNFLDFTNFIRKVIKNGSKKWERLNYQEYLKYGRWKKSHFLLEWVLQEYIINPALFENKKFHIRGYYLFYQGMDNKKGYIFHNSRIALANKEYQKDKFYDKNIHDTHLPINPIKNVINLNPHIYKLMTINQIKSFEKELKYLFKCITKINKVKCYSTDMCCYNLYGYDIMLTEDFKIKLIECNLFPGLPPHNANIDKINHPYHIFDGIIECIIDKQFKVKKLTNKNKKFIQVF